MVFSSAAVLECRNSVAPCAKPSNSAQCPPLCQGDATYSFSSVHFCVSCGRFCMYVLPTEGELLFIFSVLVGLHSVFHLCLLLTWCENLLLPSW